MTVLIICAIVLILYVLLRFGDEEISEGFDESYRLRLGISWLFCVFIHKVPGTEYFGLSFTVFGLSLELYRYRVDPIEDTDLGDGLPEMIAEASRWTLHKPDRYLSPTYLVSAMACTRHTDDTHRLRWVAQLLDVNFLTSKACTGVVLSWCMPITDYK